MGNVDATPPTTTHTSISSESKECVTISMHLTDLVFFFKYFWGQTDRVSPIFLTQFPKIENQ